LTISKNDTSYIRISKASLFAFDPAKSLALICPATLIYLKSSMDFKDDDNQ